MIFPLHYECTVFIEAPVEKAFAYLDDFRMFSSHMEKSSAMMMGSKMRISTDELGGRAIGSKVCMAGRVLGINLSLEEIVTERQAPYRKAWQTLSAKLLVIGQYRLGFELFRSGTGSALRVFIDYEPASRVPGRWLARWLARVYARWCTDRLAADAAGHFRQRD